MMPGLPDQLVKPSLAMLLLSNQSETHKGMANAALSILYRS